MKVYLANDTSLYHGGSAAVVASLSQKLKAQGHEIFQTTLRPLLPEHRAIEACDMMIVNGEGAMAQEKRSWHKGRAAGLLNGLAYAKELGKRAYLINSVWYRMEPGWADILRTLDGVWVREVSSQREMEEVQGYRPEVYVDLSYSCAVDESSPCADLRGKEVVGYFYQRNMPRFGRFDHHHRMFKGMPQLSLGGQAERKLEVTDWSYLVNSLRGVALYVTGQHHGVYAASRARVPFALFRVNTHKLSGLFTWAGVDIPIAGTRGELLKAMEWARSNREAFERFFDWMALQPAWCGP